ncbi:PKD domain-containing protein [Hyalangium minutum]|uniref:Putative lipoprotein n=1 Tax=Hyalangium minutum TaxID=394096 RepID=A0A085W685_9BACT|nr:PKD domain-containing protein [Hyalangium minutum]KFE63198.1 putative lipoprotein [Hyalangium minutum]
MRSSPSLSLKVPLSVLSVLAVGLVAPGCHRALKPDVGQDRTVEAGVPLEFGSAQEGAPEVTWNFGDGTPVQKATRASHAFPRAGTFTVQALEGATELGAARITVVPRPVLRAIPADATVAFFVPQLRGNVEPMVDFYKRLVGPEVALRQIDEAPFLPLVLQSAKGDASAVDPDEGFGLFSVPVFEGSVAVLGVTDGAAALEAVVKDFESEGLTVQRRGDGSARIELRASEPVLAFLDRGYLYLAMPEKDEPKAGEPVKASTSSPDPEGVRRYVQGFTGAGLSESSLLMELRGKVQEGNLYLFSSFPKKEKDDGFPGFFSSLRVKEGRAEVDGFLASAKPLLAGKQGPVPALLEKAPVGPVAAAMMSIPPDELATALLGAPGSPRRAEALASWSQEGVDGEALIGSVRGDVTMLVYFDAPAFYRNFLTNKRPEPRGSVLLEAGLTRAEPVVAALTKAFAAGSWNVETVKEKNVTKFRLRMMEQPMVVSVAPDRLSLQAGEALDARPRENIGTALRERFSANAFGPSHLSLMVDMGRLRAEMDAPTQVPGVPTGQLAAAKAFGGAFLDQVTPFDHAFVDLAPEEGGARLRGRIVIRTR